MTMTALENLKNIELNNSNTPAVTSKLLKKYFRQNPERKKLFFKIRRHTGSLVTSNYDISNECNLTCEGCLFFEGDNYKKHADTKTADEYEEFWKKEKDRGVNYPYIAGAEPALKQDRLISAAKYFDKGLVVSNGTIKLKEEIPFRIHLSLWGDEEITKNLRGGAVFHKPLRLYADDPRVVFIFTISDKNIHVLANVVKICNGYGAKVSFNHFSPTVSYLDKLSNHINNDNKYFRISSEDDNLIFTEDDLEKARDTVDDLMEKYPETIIYSHAYNKLVTTPGGIYDIDPDTGWATDCASKNIGHHRHFHVDLETDDAKCCSPNIDCGTCRAYLQSYGSFTTWFTRFLQSEELFDDWLEIKDTWARLFLVDWDTLNVSS